MSATSEDRILAAIRAVPRGEVAGYGHIAQRAGLPGRARLVARVLAHNADPALPWHRILRSDGRIAFAEGTRGWREQSQRLRAEGVRVERGRVRMPAVEDTLDAMLWGGAMRPPATSPRRRTTSVSTTSSQPGKPAVRTEPAKSRKTAAPAKAAGSATSATAKTPARSAAPSKSTAPANVMPAPRTARAAKSTTPTPTPAAKSSRSTDSARTAASPGKTRSAQPAHGTKSSRSAKPASVMGAPAPSHATRNTSARRRTQAPTR